MMKTTQLLIDHLIIGTQAVIWIILFALCFTEITWLNINSYVQLDEISNIAIIILVSLTYPMGIIIDNIADLFLKKWAKKIRTKVPNGSLSMRKLLLQLKDQELIEYFDYLRTRIRICRSTGLNFLLITFFGILLIALKFPSDLKFKYILLTLAVGLTISISGFWSWKLLTQTFAKSIAKRYKELESK